MRKKLFALIVCSLFFFGSPFCYGADLSSARKARPISRAEVSQSTKNEKLAAFPRYKKFLQAALLFNERKFPECIKLLDQINQEPIVGEDMSCPADIANMYFMRGLCNSHLKAIFEAELDFEQAIKAYPECFPAYDSLVMLLVNKGDLVRALDLAKTEVRLVEGTDGKPYNNLANVYLRMHEPKKALAVALDGVKIAPLSWMLLDTVGDAYMDLNNPREAFPYYDKAVKVQQLVNERPYPALIFNRGKCYEALGEKEKALEDYRTVEKINGENAKESKERIKALQEKN